MDHDTFRQSGHALRLPKNQPLPTSILLRRSPQISLNKPAEKLIKFEQISSSIANELHIIICFAKREM